MRCLRVDVRRDLRRVEASDEDRLEPGVARVLRSEERHDDVAPEHLDELDRRADRRALERGAKERTLDEDARACGRRRHGDTRADTQPGRMRSAMLRVFAKVPAPSLVNLCFGSFAGSPLGLYVARKRSNPLARMYASEPVPMASPSSAK